MLTYPLSALLFIAWCKHREHEGAPWNLYPWEDAPSGVIPNLEDDAVDELANNQDREVEKSFQQPLNAIFLEGFPFFQITRKGVEGVKKGSK